MQGACTSGQAGAQGTDGETEARDPPKPEGKLPSARWSPSTERRPHAFRPPRAARPPEVSASGTVDAADPRAGGLAWPWRFRRWPGGPAHGPAAAPGPEGLLPPPRLLPRTALAGSGRRLPTQQEAVHVKEQVGDGTWRGHGRRHCAAVSARWGRGRRRARRPAHARSGPRRAPRTVLRTLGPGRPCTRAPSRSRARAFWAAQRAPSRSAHARREPPRAAPQKSRALSCSLPAHAHL